MAGRGVGWPEIGGSKGALQLAGSTGGSADGGFSGIGERSTGGGTGCGPWVASGAAGGSGDVCGIGAGVGFDGCARNCCGTAGTGCCVPQPQPDCELVPAGAGYAGIEATVPPHSPPQTSQQDVIPPNAAHGLDIIENEAPYTAPYGIPYGVIADALYGIPDGIEEDAPYPQPQADP